MGFKLNNATQRCRSSSSSKQHPTGLRGGPLSARITRVPYSLRREERVFTKRVFFYSTLRDVDDFACAKKREKKPECISRGGRGAVVKTIETRVHLPVHIRCVLNKNNFEYSRDVVSFYYYNTNIRSYGGGRKKTNDRTVCGPKAKTSRRNSRCAKNARGTAFRSENDKIPRGGGRDRDDYAYFVTALLPMR